MVMEALLVLLVEVAVVLVVLVVIKGHLMAVVMVVLVFNSPQHSEIHYPNLDLTVVV